MFGWPGNITFDSEGRDLLIGDILRAQSTMSGDLRSCQSRESLTCFIVFYFYIILIWLRSVDTLKGSPRVIYLTEASPILQGPSWFLPARPRPFTSGLDLGAMEFGFYW